ncbi:MAG TPA: hypothetical protein VGF21_15525, partial [Thermoleophilaceae bacterium]
NVLQRVFQIYQDQFGLLIPAALLIFAPIAIINGIILSSGLVLGFLLTAIVGAIGTFLFQGMVVEAARDIIDGRRDHDVGSLVSAAAPFILPLAGAGILAAIGIGIGFILLIVPGLFLLTIWAVIAPVIVLERSGAMASFGRSQQLVKGYFWPVFLVLLCLFIIQAILSGVLNALVHAIVSNIVGYVIGDLISRALIGPLSALAAAVLYFELKRVRGEPIPGQEAATIPQAGAPQQTGPPAAPPDQPVAAPEQPTMPRQVPPSPPQQPPPAPPDQPIAAPEQPTMPRQVPPSPPQQPPPEQPPPQQ